MLYVDTRADKNKNRRNSRYGRKNNFLRNYRHCRRVPRIPKSRDYSLKSTRNPKSTTSYSLQTQRVTSPLNGAAYVRDKLPAWKSFSCANYLSRRPAWKRFSMGWESVKIVRGERGKEWGEYCVNGGFVETQLQSLRSLQFICFFYLKLLGNPRTWRFTD